VSWFKGQKGTPEPDDFLQVPLLFLRSCRQGCPEKLGVLTLSSRAIGELAVSRSQPIGHGGDEGWSEGLVLLENAEEER